MKLDADRKTTIIIVALFLSSYLLIFVVGYYVGKKNALDECSENIKQDAFSDRVYASLYTLSEGQEQETQDQSVTQEVQEIAEAVTVSSSEEKLYTAILVGFGAESSALKYIDSLRSRGISARVLGRVSRTSRGSKRTWYQVATEPASLQHTQDWVHRVSLSDKLQGVVIKEYEQTSNELANQG